MNLVSKAALAALALTAAACSHGDKGHKDGMHHGMGSDMGTKSVYFATGSSNVDAAGQEAVRMAAMKARECGSCKVKLKGFTDASGNKDANMRLSERRVSAVASALQAAGVNADKIYKRSEGELSGANHDRNNRRVDITVKHWNGMKKDKVSQQGDCTVRPGAGFHHSDCSNGYSAM